jgi:hypothetical protein
VRALDPAGPTSVGGRRLSEATTPVRDSSLAVLIGPRVIARAEPRSPASGESTLRSQKINVLRREMPVIPAKRSAELQASTRGLGWIPACGLRPCGNDAQAGSHLAVENAVEGIEGPGETVAYLVLRFLELALVGLEALELGPQGIAFALDGRQPLPQRAVAR